MKIPKQLNTYCPFSSHMFLRTKKTVLEQVEKQDPELAAILGAINELYRMTVFKISVANRFLEKYELGKFYFKPKAEFEKFMKSNDEALNRLEKLIESEKNIKRDERYRKQVFAREIENISEALKLLRTIRNLIRRETMLINYAWKLEIGPRVFRALTLLGRCVKREAELLEIESSKIAIIKQELKNLSERIKLNIRLPIVESRYYHVSPFVFNVGDVVRPSGPRKGGMQEYLQLVHNIDLEKIFEDVRKEEFPDRPSRFNCVYVTDDPRVWESRGCLCCRSPRDCS